MALHFHTDCTNCCEIGRCHWCLNKPGPAILRNENGVTFRACDKHAELVKSHERFPKNVVLVGYDGAFLPKETFIDKEYEAARRNIDAIHTINSGTPATLR